MYILEVNHGGGEIHRHFLLPGQTYTLGRKECRILLPAAEPSISRHHATIVVAPMPRYSVLDPAAQLEIRIEDVSKHGTFVDRERVGKDNTRFLYPEDRIRLGLRVTARIIPMVLILGISPDLTDEHLDLVLDSAVHIGALVVEDVIPAPLQYYERHTNCVGFLYVAEDNFAMEETMMAALGYGYTLVTPSYIAHLVKCVEETDTLMPSEFPTPSSPSPGSLGLRAVHYRRPAQTFFSVTEFLSIGRPIVADVFRSYSFLVLGDTLRETYKDVLERFGGVVESLTVDGVAQWRNQHPQTGPYPLTTCALVAEEDFRILSEAVMQRDGATGDFATPHAKPQITGYLRLYKCGVCIIPEENVHLALYRNDGKELNTKANACYLQCTSEDLLADDTADTAVTPTPAAATVATPAEATTPPKTPEATASKTTLPTAPATPSEKSDRDGAPAAAAAGGTKAAPDERISVNAMHAPGSPLMSPPTSSNVTMLVPVQARHSRENSATSAARADSTERSALSSSSAATPSLASASPMNPPVNAGRGTNSRAGSTTQPAQPTPSTITPAESTTPPTAPAATTAAAVVASPPPPPPAPALDAASLTAGTAAPTLLHPPSSGSSTTAADANSVTASLTTTPTAAAKATTTSSEASTTPTAAAATAAAVVPVAATSSSAEENTAATTAAAAPTETSTVVPRSRLVGTRASHPFNLGLRARLSGGTHSDDGDETADAAEKSASSVLEANGDNDDATLPVGRRIGAAASIHRAGGSARRPSLGGQASPVILPLKSEEVMRPRSRTRSGSQQTAYAAAVAALGRKSIGHSEERPPLAPSDEASHHLVSIEEAQRRSSGSAEPAGQASMSPPPPATAPASTATTTTSTAAPLLQRAPSKTAQPATTVATAPTTAAPIAVAAASASPVTPPALEKTPSNGPSGTATTHASVRRGEQRLATGTVPTPRRSVVRVNPALASAHAERSASPQQQQPSAASSSSHARLRRFTTPERDVVVHGATQVGKSPPRQRVEAVRIATAASERRASVSHDPETSVPRHTDAEEEAAVAEGSMGNRRSVLRRESVNTAHRPPPTGGSVTRRASSSFHRSDSAQLREMATPHRLTTSRVSNSVPRRRSKVYGSVPRQRSPEPTSEEVSGSAEVSAPGMLSNPGPLAAAQQQRASIRRRRGSPTQGNGASSGDANGGGGSTAVPGQIPGLRGGSAAPVLGSTSSATAETYFRINDELNTHCQKFMKEFMDDFMSETERVTRSVVRQTYMDAPSKETLENGMQRILEFLQYVNSTEPDIPIMYSTSSTRAACHQVRQKSQYALSKIKACYKSVNCKVPSSLTRARAALSTRNVSPTQRRLNSVAGVQDTGSGRRQSAF